MSDTDWRKFLDELLGGKGIQQDPGCMDEMTERQKWTVNECKKSLKRLKNNT
jgi:hypothetical protein